MKFSKLLAVLIIVILAIVALVAYSYFNQNNGSPNLTFDFPSSSGKASEQTTLTLNITNHGFEAKGVVVHLASEAFDHASSNPTDILSNQSASVSFELTVNDVPNGDYGVTITYEYRGISEVKNGNSESFYVIPSVQIVDEHWSGLGIFEESKIKQNDNTIFYFKIKNDLTSTYTGLTATVKLPPNTLYLTITPPTVVLDSLGPTGTSREYTFTFASNGTPPGTYDFEVQIISGQYEAFKDTFTIWVEQ